MIVPVVPIVLGSIQQYYYDTYSNEYAFYNYAVLNSTSGKFRLIEYGPDTTLYGVTFVSGGTDLTVAPPLSGAFAYEYTKVK